MGEQVGLIPFCHSIVIFFCLIYLGIYLVSVIGATFTFLRCFKHQSGLEEEGRKKGINKIHCKRIQQMIKFIQAIHASICNSYFQGVSCAVCAQFCVTAEE